jgi:hypothetical protein
MHRQVLAWLKVEEPDSILPVEKARDCGLFLLQAVGVAFALVS